MTAAGAENEHGGHNVPGALHGFGANVASDSGVENRQGSLLSYGSQVQMSVSFVMMLLSVLVFGTLMALVWTNTKKTVVVVNGGENIDLQHLLSEPISFEAREHTVCYGRW